MVGAKLACCWLRSPSPTDCCCFHIRYGAASKPDQPRIQHLPQIKVPVMFVHGTHDPFGSIEEIEAARKLILGKTLLVPVEGSGHDLGFKGKSKAGEVAIVGG